MVKQGKAKVDATLTDSPRKPKGKKTYELSKDRQEDQRQPEEVAKEEAQAKLIEAEQPGVDHQARWLKKRGKLHYGYKNHTAVDEDGLVKAVYTTTANEDDSKGLVSLLDKLKGKCSSVYADKGYKTSSNDKELKDRNLKNRIQDKAYRNTPLTDRQKLRNKLISKERYKVERTFGSQKKWFGGGICRYVGIAKAHTQHILLSIAYNLKRSPQLVWDKSIQ